MAHFWRGKGGEERLCVNFGFTALKMQQQEWKKNAAKKQNKTKEQVAAWLSGEGWGLVRGTGGEAWLAIMLLFKHSYLPWDWEAIKHTL